MFQIKIHLTVFAVGRAEDSGPSQKQDAMQQCSKVQSLSHCLLRFAVRANVRGHDFGNVGMLLEKRNNSCEAARCNHGVVIEEQQQIAASPLRGLIVTLGNTLVMALAD